MICRTILTGMVLASLLTGCGQQKPTPKTTSSSKKDDASSTEKSLVSLPTTPSPVTNTPPVPPKNYDVSKPEFKFTALQWFDEFAGDKEKAAREKYAGKVIEVSGLVKFFNEVGSPDNFQTQINLKVDKDPFADLRIFTKDQTPWTQYGPESSVVVQGVFLAESPINGQPSKACDLHQAIVSKKEGSPVPSVNLIEIMKEATGKSELFARNYNSKSFLIEGQIQALENTKSSSRIKLQAGPNRSPIDVTFCSDTMAYDKGLKNGKPGQTVWVYGTILVEGDVVRVISGMLSPIK